MRLPLKILGGMSLNHEDFMLGRKIEREGVEIGKEFAGSKIFPAN